MREQGSGEAVHVEPVWRHLSDFIIAGRLSETHDVRTEQLWARRAGTHQFEVCCIPFFLYDVALGDLVETDDQYVIRRTVRRSGRFVFRAWFQEPVQEEVTEELEGLGSLLEWSSPHLLAIDAKDEEHAQAVADSLSAREHLKQLEYETGRLHGA